MLTRVQSAFNCLPIIVTQYNPQPFLHLVVRLSIELLEPGEFRVCACERKLLLSNRTDFRYFGARKLRYDNNVSKAPLAGFRDKPCSSGGNRKDLSLPSYRHGSVSLQSRTAKVFPPEPRYRQRAWRCRQEARTPLRSERILA